MAENENFDLSNAMADLLKQCKTGTLKDLQQNKIQIQTIAEKCRRAGFYPNIELRIQKNTQPLNASETFQRMVKEIAGYASPFVAELIAIMYMPIIDEKLSFEKGPCCIDPRRCFKCPQDALETKGTTIKLGDKSHPGPINIEHHKGPQ